MQTMMERQLIHIAKLHGYMTTVSMMCTGIGIYYTDILLAGETPFCVLVWLVFPISITVAVVQEDAKLLKLLKRLYVVVSIVAVMLIIGRSKQTSNYKLPLLCATLYGCYVFHFLYKLFVELHKQQSQATVTMTAIVCESQPVSSSVVVKQAQQQPEQNHSELPPPYETILRTPDSTEKAKDC